MRSLPSPFKRGFNADRADRLATALKAIADPARLRIISLLHGRGELSVLEVREALGYLAQPTVSHHLGILAEAGIVSCRKGGVWRFYSLAPQALADLGVSLRGAK